MCKSYRIAFLFLILSCVLTAEEKRINGYLKDETSGRALTGASIVIKDRNLGVVSNQTGWFSISVKESDTLEFNYIGYYSKYVAVKDIINLNMPILVKLPERPLITSTVVVETDRKEINSYNQTGYFCITPQEIKYQPSVGGESDITKTMQMLPGVQTLNEGSARLNIRGGSDDQNMILIDGAQIYNPMHILGYISSFNTDAISGVELMKGYIPPEHSGKLSSVMNVSLKEGNKEKTNIGGGISLLSSQLYVDGSIGDKFTYMISGRRTYIDLVLGEFEVDFPKYSYYDVYAKFGYELSKKDRFFLSGYFGRDDFSYESRFYIDKDDNNNFWGNKLFNFRYNRIWNSSVFTDFSIIYSNYGFTQVYNNMRKKPSLDQYTLKSKTDYIISDDLSFKFGGDFNFYKFDVTSDLKYMEDNSSYKINSFEGNIFASIMRKFNERFQFDGGIAISLISEDKTNSLFAFIEPRFCMSYYFDDDFSAKLSYTMMHQNIQLLSSNRFFLPTDIFYPSIKNMKPITGDQISAGIAKGLKLGSTKYETSLEIYYKNMNHLSQFRQNFSNADPYYLKDQLLFGRGWAYGMEVQISKREGSTTGWINYTWNKVYRSMDGKNNNKPYYPKFFREHQLNIVLNQNISRNLQFSANFVLASGQYITLPINEYFFTTDDPHNIPRNYSNIGYVDYGDLNSYKLPLYNRLDLSIVHFFKMWGGNWELFASAYNIYNYPNPTFLWYSISANKFYRTTVGILPTFGLRFNY